MNVMREINQEMGQNPRRLAELREYSQKLRVEKQNEPPTDNGPNDFQRAAALADRWIENQQGGYMEGYGLDAPLIYTRVKALEQKAKRNPRVKLTRHDFSPADMSWKNLKSNLIQNSSIFVF